MSYDLNLKIVPIHEPVAAEPALAHSGHAQTAAAPATLLIVDDETLIVDSLAAIFRRSGFRVLTAYNGADALETALQTPPDLLITDVAMPGMDGIELAIHLAGALPACKIMLFSAHASTLDLNPARQKGYNFPLLAKPMHPKIMLDRVIECLQGDPALAS